MSQAGEIILSTTQILKCEFCPFTTESPIGLRVHRGKQHEIKRHGF